jgi:iron(III) transport system ATP-binding protein
MLMDEPFSGLDNRLRDGIRDETLDLLKERGDLRPAGHARTRRGDAHGRPDRADARRADRAAGAPYNIYNAPADREAVAFFSDINVLRGKVQGALTRPLRPVPRARRPDGGT